jgi:hypothetical protein
MNEAMVDFEAYQEQYSIYTPCGVLYVCFDEAGRRVTGHEAAINYFDTMLRLGVTGEDGRMIEQTQYTGDDLIRFVDGQHGLLVVVTELL